MVNHGLGTLSSDMESLGSSREHTMEWKLPLEEQVYEKLPWTRGALFNTVVSTAIFLNTVWLGIETDLHHPEQYENQSLDPWTVVNYCFVFFFCVELLIRIYSRTWWPFIMDNWNKFDFLLVVLSILDTFVLEYISDGSGSLSALRVLRVLRVARVLRLLRFFRPLWLLVIGALDAMRALLWAWVLISILIYIFAILLTRTVGFPHKADAEIDRYFGNILYSSFTLFQVMTLEGWPTVARKAMEFEPWTWMVFVAFLLITTFSIMNMIVSVIVDSTLEAALDQKLQAMRDQEYQTSMATVKVDEVFRRADGNGDGHITKEELMQALLKADVRLYLREVGIDITNAEFIFDVVDYDGSGKLEYKEFAMALVKARGEAKAQDVLALQCDLWRREYGLRQDLFRVCVKVDERLRAVDQAIELLQSDLQILDRAMAEHE